MAKTVDILRYILGLDAKPFRSEARRVDKDVRKLRSGVTKAGTAFSKLGLFITGAAAALAALKLGGLVKDATLVAARIEVLNNVFRLTGNAAGKTNAELEFTKQKLIALGIAEKEALQIGLRFIQVQLDLADSLKIARAAQDLAVVAGTDSSTTALRLTEAIVKQRPILLKQFGIVANLDNIYGKMATTLGKNVAELTENERRTAFLNTILEKAKTVAGSYEKAMELVGKRLTSLPRHFQNAQKAVGQHFLPAMRAAVDGAADFLQIITESFQTAEQDFTKSLFKFSSGFEKFAKVAPQIARLREEFEELTSISKRTEPQQTKLNKVIKALGDILPETRVVLRGYNDDLEGTRLALDKVIERNKELQRLELLDVLAKQAEAFRLNTERIEELNRTATRGNERRGRFAANIVADTERVNKATSQLAQLADEQIRIEGQLANARGDGGDRTEKLTEQLKENAAAQELALGALVEANKAVISYEAEVARLNAANDAQLANWNELFPSIKDNELAFRLLTAEAKELLAALLELQAAQDESARKAKLISEGGLVGPPVPFAVLFPKPLTSDEDLRARAAELFDAARIKRLEAFFARRNRLQKAHDRLVERQRKLTESRDKAEDQREKDREIRRNNLRLQRIKDAQDITKTLDVLSVGLSFIDGQMAGLVTRAADFTEALATGDIFAKIGAGIGLVGTALGLISGGGPSRQEVFDQRAADRARRLEESQERLRQALDELKDAIIGDTIESTQAELDLLLEARNLFNELTLGSDKLGLEEFNDLFNRLNNILNQFGLGPVFRETDPRTGGFTFGQGGINESVFDAFNSFFQEIFNTLKDAGLALEPFGSLDEFQKMIDILEDIAQSGGLQGETGLELIRFWTTFADLTLAQQEELLNALLSGVELSGDITREGLIELLSQLETLGDQIEAEEKAAAADGLTQIQRSVTTITEGQANIIAATLNSILSVLGLMDTKLAQIVTGLIGTESGGFLGGVGAPLAAIPKFGSELPGMLASLLGIEEKLGSFLDRVAANIGPTITVQPGGIIVNQTFIGDEKVRISEQITAEVITQNLIQGARAEGIQI